MNDGTHVDSNDVQTKSKCMSNAPIIRPQGRWFIARYAMDNHLTLAEAESTLTTLIARGHLKIIFGEGARGVDEFIFVTEKEPR